MSDHRPLLRHLIRTFFTDYVRLVEPDSVGKMRLDLTTFPPLERYTELTEDDQLDLGVVAEVPARRGGIVTVFVQVEEEVRTPPEAASRLGRYLTGLELRYGQPVFLSILYLRGGRPGVRLESAAIGEAFGIELARIFYTAFCLEGMRAEYYLERPEPLAWALAALMRPLQRGPEEHRQACLGRIAAAGLSPQRRGLLCQAVEAFSASSLTAGARPARRARG